MLKKSILVIIGLLAFIIIFIYSMDWGTVKSNLKKTEYKLEGDHVFEEKIIYDLHLFDTLTYKASTTHKDNLELLFNIEGLKKTTGRFNDVNVVLNVKKKREQSKLLVTIKTNSVFTNNKLRDESLVSDEFFNAKKYPEITYESDSLVNDNQIMIAYGKLSFMGQTKPLSFPFIVLGKTTKNNKITYGVNGKFDFDRTQYGMVHEPGVGDIVHISFYLDFIE